MLFAQNHFYLKILKIFLLLFFCTCSHFLSASKIFLKSHKGFVTFDSRDEVNKRYEYSSGVAGYRSKRASYFDTTSSNSKNSSKSVVFVINNRNKNNLTIDLHKCNLDDSNFCKTLNDSLSDRGLIGDVSVISVVNLSQNYLQQLNYNYLNKFVNLQQLDLSRNNLSAIVSLASDHLEYLNVSFNQILRFSSEKLKNLKHLDLSNNVLNESRYIVLYDLLHLHSVDLSCNFLVTVDKNLFLNNRNLRRIDLSGNQLSAITRDTFNNLDNLEVLDLSNNNVSWIENDTFSCLPNLQYLNLAENDIHIASIRALQGIPDLIGLSLAFNRHLNDVNDALQGFVASWSLRELDISGTDLCDIPAALTQSVRMLNLAENYLQVISCGDLDSYPLLQFLMLSHNLIFDIEDDALGRLEILTTLYLDHNKLSRIPTSLPSSLVQLHLSANTISDIQPSVFAHLSSLKMLDLSNNQIGYLQELPLPNLVTLSIKSASLRGISQAVVITSPKLKDLYLDGNPVKCGDLLGIATWASPCREEKLFDQSSAEETAPSYEHNYYFIRNTNNVHKKCSKHHKMSNDKNMPNEFQINCLKTKIITPSTLFNEHKDEEKITAPATTITIPTNNDNNYTKNENENENLKNITFSNQLDEVNKKEGKTKYTGNKKINDNDDGIKGSISFSNTTTQPVVIVTKETKETDKSFDVINQFTERFSQAQDGRATATTPYSINANNTTLLQFNDSKEIGDNDKTDTTTKKNNNDKTNKQQPMEELNFDMLPSSNTLLLNDKNNDNKTFPNDNKSDVLQAKSEALALPAIRTTTATTATTTVKRYNNEIFAKLHIYENDKQQTEHIRVTQQQEQEVLGNKTGFVSAAPTKPTLIAPQQQQQQQHEQTTTKNNTKIMPKSSKKLIIEENDNNNTKLLNKTSSLSFLSTSSAQLLFTKKKNNNKTEGINTGVVVAQDKNINLVSSTNFTATKIVDSHSKENNKLIYNDKLSKNVDVTFIENGNDSNIFDRKLEINEMLRKSNENKKIKTKKMDDKKKHLSDFFPRNGFNKKIEHMNGNKNLDDGMSSNDVQNDDTFIVKHAEENQNENNGGTVEKVSKLLYEDETISQSSTKTTTLTATSKPHQTGKNETTVIGNGKENENNGDYMQNKYEQHQKQHASTHSCENCFSNDEENNKTHDYDNHNASINFNDYNNHNARTDEDKKSVSNEKTVTKTGKSFLTTKNGGEDNTDSTKNNYGGDEKNWTKIYGSVNHRSNKSNQANNDDIDNNGNNNNNTKELFMEFPNNNHRQQQRQDQHEDEKLINNNKPPPLINWELAKKKNNKINDQLDIDVGYNNTTTETTSVNTSRNIAFPGQTNDDSIKENKRVASNKSHSINNELNKQMNNNTSNNNNANDNDNGGSSRRQEQTFNADEPHTMMTLQEKVVAKKTAKKKKTTINEPQTAPPPPPLLLLEHADEINDSEDKIIMITHPAIAAIKHTNNTTGTPQKLNDIRHSSGHPGLFIIIGLTVGIIVSFGLLHLYKCHQPLFEQQQQQQQHQQQHHQQFNFNDNDSNEFDEDDDSQTMHDLLRMEMLTSGQDTVTHHYCAPKERW